MPCGVHGTSAGLAAPQPPDIERVKAVDVLRRIERGDHRLRIDAARQRQLDEDAVDPVVGIEPVDQLEDRRGVGIRRQTDIRTRRSRPRRRRAPCCEHRLARRVVADEDRGEAGGDLMALAQDAAAAATRRRSAAAIALPSISRSPRPSLAVTLYCVA